MKLYTISNNAHVVTDDKGIHTLFSYESEVLRYNPKNKDMTVYTRIANYSRTTKKHVRIFCSDIIQDPNLEIAILDPKKSYKDYKILHIINE